MREKKTNLFSDFEILKEKVPDFKSPWKTALIIIFGLLLFAGCFALVLWVDRLFWYGPLITQLALATFGAFFYLEIVLNRKKIREKYLAKYGALAYRPFFYRHALPPLIPMFIGSLHPLFISGPKLMPWWIALPLGAFLVLTFLLSQRPAVTGEFDIKYHLWMYTIFPENAKLLRTGIYSIIRHQHYAFIFFGTLGFGILRNNLIAILCVLIYSLPFVFFARLEEEELIERFGDDYRNYMKETPAFFPQFKNILKFLRLIFGPQ